MLDTYKINIEGLERSLPVCKVNDKLSIAAFDMFSDVELTIKSAEGLLKKVPDFDVIVTPEAKGIPLSYEMARQSGKNYIIARKEAKLYMKNPIKVDVRSITTNRMQTLVLDEYKASLLKEKRVLIVDDVISTGESLKAVKVLVDAANGVIVGQCAVLAEGDAENMKGIFYLNTIPLIVND